MLIFIDTVHLIFRIQTATMAVEFRRVTQDALIPTSVNACFKDQCSCFTNPCLGLINPTEFVVYPNQLNIQSMGFEIIMPPGFIFQVTNHCNDKPWRIPTQFLNHNTDKESFCLPLISSQKAVIAKGEIIAHIQLLPILDAYEIIKGNLCHNKNVIKTYLNRTIVSDADLVYMSDTDENLSDSKDEDVGPASPVEETAPQEKNLKAAKRKINKRKLSSSSDDIDIAMF